jgi:hypothetical protein
MSVDLTGVPVDELLKELSRRLECTKKPERRLILIGIAVIISYPQD